MLKSDFEKRHGRIYEYNNAIVDGYITNLTKKYGLQNQDQPASIWHVVKNMPGSHFTELNLEKIQEIFTHLENVQPKELRDYYLGTLDDRFFSDGWGWFSRGGRGLSTYTRKVGEIPREEKKLAVRVLKTLKRGFKKYHYRARYGTLEYINRLIVQYGGVVDNSAQVLYAAKEKIERAEKLPRKLKKRVKNGFLATLFQNTTTK